MFTEIRDFVKTWFNRAMTEPDINSRIVFLAQGMASTIAVLVLTGAFIFAHNKETYPYMVGAVMGGGAAAAFGRAATKATAKTPPSEGN